MKLSAEQILVIVEALLEKRGSLNPVSQHGQIKEIDQTLAAIKLAFPAADSLLPVSYLLA